MFKNTGRLFRKGNHQNKRVLILKTNNYYNSLLLWYLQIYSFTTFQVPLENSTKELLFWLVF